MRGENEEEKRNGKDSTAPLHLSIDPRIERLRPLNARAFLGTRIQRSRQSVSHKGKYDKIKTLDSKKIKISYTQCRPYLNSKFIKPYRPRRYLKNLPWYNYPEFIERKLWERFAVTNHPREIKEGMG